MKCASCHRTFAPNDTVMQTSLRDKTITVCDVKSKPACAQKVDEGRGQKDAFPKTLWRTQTYKVHAFDCVGAMVKNVGAAYKDGKVIEVKLILPGGASMDEISGFMGDTVRVELQKEMLVAIAKSQATGKKSAPKQPGEKDSPKAGSAKPEKKKETGKK